MKKDCEEENCVVPVKNGGGLAEKKSEIEKNVGNKIFLGG